MRSPWLLQTKRCKQADQQVSGDRRDAKKTERVGSPKRKSVMNPRRSAVTNVLDSGGLTQSGSPGKKRGTPLLEFRAGA
jgi:hypothetical protein